MGSSKCILNFMFLLLVLQVKGGSVDSYDLPKCEDLETYMNAVEEAIHFMNSLEADTNTAFSMLVVKGNMLHAAKTLNLTKDIEDKINRIGPVVASKVYSDKFPLKGPWLDDLGMTNLFNLTHVPELDASPIKPVTTLFRSLDEYIRNFTALDHTVNLSMTCFEDYEKLRHENSSVKCNLSEKCLFFLLHGANYGYGISHRLAIISLANSRGCYVFTPEDDKSLKHRFCSAMYNEAQYLVNNNFTSLDLLAEEVFLCSSLCYTQFLSRSWFKTFLAQQSNYGCFENTQFPEFSVRGYDIDVLCAKNVTYADFLKSRNCDIHFTSLATASLTVGSRYLMQKCQNSDIGK